MAFPPPRMNATGYDRAATAMAGLLLAAAIGFGGQGVYPTFVETIPQLLAVMVIAFVLAAAPREAIAPGSTWIAVVIGAIALVPLIQLIPLPFSTWQGLPFREFAVDAVKAAGYDHPSMPLSLDPDATRNALRHLLPAVAMAAIGSTLSRRGLIVVMGVIAAAGLVSLLFGFAQVMAGAGGALYPYPGQYGGLSLGVFSNRNHQADMIVMALLMAGAFAYVVAPRSAIVARHRFVLTIGMVALAGAGVLATQSRSGALMFVIATLCVMGGALLEHGRKWLGRLAAAMAVGLVLGIVAARGALSGLLARSDVAGDLRFEFWPDAWYLAKAVWPAGTGIGTFELAYQQVESLASVTDKLVNSAHNEYLQALIEAGVAAPIVLIVFLAWLARSAIGLARRRAGQAGWFALIAILLLMAHAAVDFPLRTVALSTVFSALCIILARAASPHAPIANPDDGRYARND